MKENRSVLEIETFGGLTLRLSGQPLSEFVSRKADAILVFLAVTGQSVSRDVLADMFWEESPETKAKTNLRVALTSLKKQVGAFLVIERHSIGIQSPMRIWVDALELERCLTEGDIETGLALYKGDFLAGFHLRASSRFEEWQTVTRENYRLRMQESLHEQVSQCLAKNKLKTGLRYSRRLLEMDSFDEAALRRTMEILTRSGQRNAALLQYETYQEIYRDELGVEPESETVNLMVSIRQGEVVDDREAQPQLGDQSVKVGQTTQPRHNLPVQLTPFVGRERELAQLVDWLSDPDIRLITILGPGGMGKTRLCLEVGKAQTARFEDGVCFVSLTSIDDHREMISTLAATLGIRGYENVDTTSLLVHYLSSRNILLLLDNFEHLVKDVPFIVEILQAAPRVKVMTTSRERLNLRNEHIFALGGMGYPTREMESDMGGHDSATLFLQTAQRLNPDFALVPYNQLVVDKICHLVEGMPLAIELAASWVDILSLQEIAYQIETGLDILAAEMQDSPTRHQSIRLVFDATYQTLEPALKKTFNNLSIFRGSFTSQAAQKIAETSLYQLKTLVNKSLITPLDAGRFQIHDLLRQYGKEKLEELPEARKTAGDLHCDYYGDFLAQKDVQIQAGETDEAFQEIENLRAGFRWAVRNEKIPELHQYLPLFLLLVDRAPGELISLFTWALDRLRVGEPTPEKELITGVLLRIIGVQEYLSGKQVQGKEKVLEGLSILRRSSRDAGIHLAYALLMAVHLKVYGPVYDYVPLLQESLHLFRAANSYGIGIALTYAGEYELSRGDDNRANNYFLEALDASTRNNNRRGIAWASFNLGRVAEAQGAYLSAIDHYQKSASLFQEINYKQLYAVVNKYLGNINYVLKRYQTAIHYYQQFLEVSVETGIQWRLAEANTYLGITRLAMGDIALAEEYMLKAQRTGDNVNRGFLLADLGLLALTKGNYPAAVENYLSALRSQWGDWTIPVKLRAMAQTIPLLEKTGYTTLAGKIAAFILAYPTYRQIRTSQPAKDYLEKLKTELPEGAYQAILEQGKVVEMETILSELEGVLQNADFMINAGS